MCIRDRLGTSFLKLLPEEERPNVSVFIERVISGHRGSIEVDLTGLTGTRHTMQLHASPHPGAPGCGEAWSCIVWRVPVRPVRSTSIDPRCPEMTRSMKTETLGRSSSGSSFRKEVP